MEEHRVRHWSETIAGEVVSMKKEPYVVASGITTSGPTHMGTVCEFLYPSALVKYLLDEGRKVSFVFVGDIMDAFDNIPQPLQRFTSLEEHLGKPLCMVPDPYGCCASYGDHFLNELKTIMAELEVPAEVLRANDLVNDGCYDPYAVLYHEKTSSVTAIAKRVAELSGVKGLPEWIDILMPICEDCGKIATTRVTGFDGDNIEYICDKDVKYTRGCGHKGKMRLRDHRYKLYWRLDWPSRHTFLGVSAELAGIDHHTRGGSWQTSVMVHHEVLNREPPVGHGFGFVLLHGRKYSKSKGIGLSVQELLDLVPPPLIKYRLFKADLEENKEFDPSGHKLLSLYAEYNRAADLHEKGGPLQRAEEKMVLAYRLSTDRRKWRLDFGDLVSAYQIYQDWDKVAERLGDAEGVSYLQRYAENWVKQQYLPEEYVFRLGGTRVESLGQVINNFAGRLGDSISAQEVHDLVYTVAEEHGIKPTQLFEGLYQSLISKNHGPRFGRLVETLGVARARDMLQHLYK
ncbi:lysine--tRNA ligase [Candidatus Bathyarchaeota archaeon]|nr:lysine--tRNA ligase [Candidatus Bathyarchaeota archaeon]